MPPPPLTVSFGKRSAEVALPLSGTAAQLAEALAQEFAVALATIKLLLPPPTRGVVRLGEAGNLPLAEAGQASGLPQAGPVRRSNPYSLFSCHWRTHSALPPRPPLAGIRPGMHVKMMASPAAAVQAVAAAEAAGAAQRAAGFDHELRRDLRRAGLVDGSGSAAGSGAQQGQHSFRAFQAWQRPGLAPAPSEALKLLHRWGFWPAAQVGRLLLARARVRCREVLACWLLHAGAGPVDPHSPCPPAGWPRTLGLWV